MRQSRTLILGSSLALLLTAAPNAQAPFLVRDINPGSQGSIPVFLTPMNGQTYFRANDGTSGAELWRSDGTTAGTVIVSDIRTGPTGSNPASLTVANGILFFTANDGTTGIELWRSDGTAAGTRIVADINPGPGNSSPSGLRALNDIVFFSADDGVHGRELWRSDGTAAGTVMVSDIRPGTQSSSPSNFTFFGPILYFTANDGANGVELWRSLPPWVAVSTSLVADINPGAAGSSPSNLTMMGSTLLFRANDGVHGSELWRSDGTSAGTTLVADIQPGLSGSNPSNITGVGPFIIFTANDGLLGNELWRSDGTTAGTVLVADIQTGAIGSNPSSLVVGSDLSVIFIANDGIQGTELWRSSPPWVSGTTAIVRDLNPGAPSGIPPSFTVAGTSLLFSASQNTRILFSGTDGATGSEPFITDGTAAGTRLVADLHPGSASSQPGNFARLGNTVLFTANDGSNGIELWGMHIGSVGGAIAEPYGSGCPGTGGLVPQVVGDTIPVIGNAAFAISVLQARGSAPAAMFLHSQRGQVALGGGCTFYLGLPVPLNVATMTNGSGVATIPLGLPNNPTLVGADLYFQWAIADPNGAFGNLASVSSGLHVVIGN